MTAKTGRGLEATTPASVSAFVAAVSEPLLAVGCLLGVTAWYDEPIGRPVAVLCVLVLVLVFPGTNRFYDKPSRSAVEIVAAWAFVLAILALCGFATDSFYYFEMPVLLWWAALTPSLQLLWVLSGRVLLRLRASQAHTRRAALVIGAGTLGVKVAQALRERHVYGSDFVGFLEDRQLERCAHGAGGQVIGRFDDVAACIRSHHVKDVYITLPLSSQPRIVRLIASLHDSAVSIYFVPDVFGVSVIQGRMRNLDGVPVVSLLESPFVGINRLAKRISDLVIASAVLLLTAPLMVLIAAAIRLTSRGPALVAQRRNGLDGREIVVYKFRVVPMGPATARPGAAYRDEASLTTVGRWLRRSLLEELPQFINVLQGRMSVVGPRPHAVEHARQYRPIVRSYMVRHKVKPGITGWAQIHGHLGETDLAEMMAARVAYDIDYLRNWSLALDLRIILRTILLVVKTPFAPGSTRRSRSMRRT